MNPISRTTGRLLAALATLALLQTGCSLRSPAEVADNLERAASDLDEALRPAGIDAATLARCSPIEAGAIGEYVGCLAIEQAAQCRLAGQPVDQCDFSVLLAEPGVSSCAPPSGISAQCAQALAPRSERAGEPLDCRAAQAGMAVASAAYDADPYQSLDPATWTVLGTYASGSTFGFTARRDEGGVRACFVGFRGTDDADDVLLDIGAVTHTPCGELPGRCADGFLRAFEQARASGIFHATLEQVAAGGCDTLTVAGHSLGGAIADIFAAHLHQRDPQTYTRGFLSVETFGQPRVFDGFDGRLAERLHREIAKTRWVRWGDPVPALPLIDFVHTGTPRLMHHAFDWGTRSVRWTFRTAARNTSGEGFFPLHHLRAAYRDAASACR